MEPINCLPLCYRLSYDEQSMTIFWKAQKWTEYNIMRVAQLKKHEQRLQELSIYFSSTGVWNIAHTSDISNVFKTHISENTPRETIYPINIGKLAEIRNSDHRKKIAIQLLETLDFLIKIYWGELLHWSSENIREIWTIPTAKQLVAVISIDRMAAWMDDTVFDWIKTAPSDQLEAAITAMREAHIKLELGAFNKLSFDCASKHKDNFTITVPGIPDFAELNLTYNSASFVPLGQGLSGHNVTGPFEKLELLIGLAKLNDLAETALSK